MPEIIYCLHDIIDNKLEMANQRLEQLFISYGSYHSNAVNKWIHIICVPLILASLFAMIHHYKLFEVSGYSVPASLVLLTVVMLYYLTFSIPVGLACVLVYTSLWVAVDYLSKHHPEGLVRKAVIVHVVSWVLQFVGHGVFEKRKPALLDNITQVLSAPLFVVIEILFFFTMSDFKHKVEPKIDQNVAAFKQKDSAKAK